MNPTPNPTRSTVPAADPDVLECLRDVLDPELGLSVVDLGLVYRASRTSDAIHVAITLTTRACPLGGMIVEDAREGARGHDQTEWSSADSGQTTRLMTPPAARCFAARQTR